MRALNFIVLLVLALPIASCAERDRSADDLLAATPNVATPREALAVLTQREDAASRQWKPIDAPPPPGVAEIALRSRPADDRLAHMSISKALRAIARNADAAPHEKPDWLTSDPLNPEEAVNHYVRGRDAVARKQYDEAIRELLLAHNFDARSVTVARELARVYALVRNRAASIEMFEHVLVLEPRDAEAVLALAMAANERRDFARAAALLASFREAGGKFDFDPAADALAHVCLLTALDELGYDLAVSDIVEETVALLESRPAPGMFTIEFGSAYRQRGDLWRRAGDARCRLGEMDAALVAFDAAAALPAADPWSLLPRHVYALLRVGRPFAAQHVLCESLAKSAADDVDPRSVKLCAYVADWAPHREMLADAVLQLHEEHPDQPSLVRCAASLVDRQRAIAVLGDYVSEHAGDVTVLQQLLDWLAMEDLPAATDLVVSIAAEHPESLGRYAAVLLHAARDPTPLLAELEAGEASPTRSCILALVQQQLGAIGAAWDAAQEAAARWPESAVIARLSMAIAAELREPALLREALAQADQFDDAATWAARADAYRAIGDLAQAQHAAATAVTQEPEDVESLLALARTQTAIALAQPVNADARLSAWDAVHTAELVLAAHPDEERAYEILLYIFGADGPLTNTEAIEEYTAKLAAAKPASLILRRLSLETAMRQQRAARAAELALSLFEESPTEAGLLSYAVSAWAAMDDLDAANAWFEKARRDRPQDPVLLENWARVKLQRSESAAAQQELESLLRKSPQNFKAMQILEAVYRATGDFDRALELGERRLRSRPAGVQRELALASMFADAGRDDRAIPSLHWIVENGSNASLAQLTVAIELVENLEAGAELRRDLARTLLDRIVLDHPNVSMSAYLAGLQVMRTLDERDEDRLAALLDCLVQRAELDPSDNDFAALLWREIAQQLVDLKRVDGASNVLRARLGSDHPLNSAATAMLLQCCIVADAAGGATPEETIALVERTIAAATAPGEALGDDRALADVMFDAANMNTLVGNDAGAEALHRKCLALNPDHPMALNNLGYQLLEQGRSDHDTIELVERALRLAPDDPNVLDTAGWLRYKQGQFQDTMPDAAPAAANEAGAGAGAAGGAPRLVAMRPGAISLIREAMQRQLAPSAEVHDHLGDALWRTGDREGAVREWKYAHNLLADEAMMRELLAQYAFVQKSVWRLEVIDPEQIWDREFAAMRDRTQRKIDAAAEGGEPEVAPLFSELEEPEGDR